MIDRAAEKPKASAESAKAEAPEKSSTTTDAGPCAGIELMGFYKNEIFEKAMGGGVVEWLAKIRNNTSATKIVNFSWIDSNGEQRRGRFRYAAATSRLLV
jgi:hypothetical protein